MRVLIIGGTGIISTGITRQLVERNDDVVLYKRGHTSSLVEGDYTTITGNRKNFPVFEKQMQEAGAFDCVIDMFCFLPEEAESAVRAFKGHTYGEGGNNLIHPFGFGNSYLDRIKKALPIILHGNGTSFWPTCHRDDVAVAFVGALGNEKAKGRSYHAAGEEWMTWKQYHQRLAEAIGAPAPQFVYIPTDVLVRMEPQAAAWCEMNFSYNNLFDNTAARKDLGFRVTIPWIEGVRRTIAWLEENDRLEKSEDFPIYDRIIESWQRVIENLPEITAS